MLSAHTQCGVVPKTLVAECHFGSHIHKYKDLARIRIGHEMNNKFRSKKRFMLNDFQKANYSRHAMTPVSHLTPHSPLYDQTMIGLPGSQTFQLTY